MIIFFYPQKQKKREIRTIAYLTLRAFELAYSVR